MGDKKHIDRIFQEKLKDFEVFPDAEVWKNIEEQLVKKKKRRVVPLWLRLGGVAATFLMLLGTGFWYYNTVEKTPKLPEKNTIITDVDSDEQQQNLESNKQYPSVKEAEINVKEAEETTIIPIQKGTLQFKNKNTTRYATASGTQQKEKPNANQQLSPSVKEEGFAKAEIKNDAVITDENNSVIVQNTNAEKTSDVKKDESIIKTETTVIASNTENTLKKDINKALKKDDKHVAVDEKNLNDKKWSVGSTVAPIFFNTLKDGSPIHSTLASNEKTSKPSLSYGLKVNYKINKRLSLQSGINSLDLAYQTKNVSALVTSNNALSNNTNINTNVQGLKIVTLNNTNFDVQTQELAATPQRSNLTNLNGDLNQSLSYIEIPMEAKYSLLQRKVGVNVIGGMSTYILYQNGVTMENENGATTLGEASNINDMNFSGNVGLDVDYSINKKLYINVSPMFKYQFNTFSKNDGGFKPYSLGIYTGLNFRF